MKRRAFIKDSAVSALAVGAAPHAFASVSSGSARSSMNDIVDYESRYFSTPEYAGDLKAELDMLDAESPKRRRMMSVSAHDRIARRPSRAKVLEEFIVYAQSNPGVVFKRKDEIARFALSSPQTVREGI